MQQDLQVRVGIAGDSVVMEFSQPTQQIQLDPQSALAVIHAIHSAARKIIATKTSHYLHNHYGSWVGSLHCIFKEHPKFFKREEAVEYYKKSGQKEFFIGQIAPFPNPHINLDDVISLWEEPEIDFFEYTKEGNDDIIPEDKLRMAQSMLDGLLESTLMFLGREVSYRAAIANVETIQCT